MVTDMFVAYVLAEVGAQLFHEMSHIVGKLQMKRIRVLSVLFPSVLLPLVHTVELSLYMRLSTKYFFHETFLVNCKTSQLGLDAFRIRHSLLPMSFLGMLSTTFSSCGIL